MDSDAPLPRRASKKQKTHALDSDGARIKEWLLSMYTAEDGANLLRNDVYEAYQAYCTRCGLAVISAASFGKLFRYVFPFIESRRLGTRGMSRYHYCGIAQKNPANPDALLGQRRESDLEGSVATTASSALTTPWNDDESLSWDVPVTSPSLQEDRLSVTATTLPTFTAPFLQHTDSSSTRCTIRDFTVLYQNHCCRILTLVTTSCISEIEKHTSSFRSAIPEAIQTLLHGHQHLDLVDAIWRWDSALYDSIISSFLPTLYAPIPQPITRDLLDYILTVDRYPDLLWKGYPHVLCKATCDVAKLFAAKFRRLLSLNKTAQEASQVLRSADSIAKMESDIATIDMAEVLKHATFLDNDLVTEASKTIRNKVLPLLNSKANLAQWMAWIESLVTTHAPSHVPQAKIFVRAWTLCSSALMRDISLHSAPSFALLHTLHLFLDDYVFYLVEERIMVLNMTRRTTPSSTPAGASPMPLTRLSTLELSQPSS